MYKPFVKKTPLMYAAIGNHANCMKVLISAGASLDITDEEKNDALVLSLINNEDNTCPLILIRSIWMFITQCYYVWLHTITDMCYT